MKSQNDIDIQSIPAINKQYCKYFDESYTVQKIEFDYLVENAPLYWMSLRTVK